MMTSRELIEKYSLRPNKALGQNFLCDAAATERIVSAASEPRLPIIEIGPGLGALTFPLAETGLSLTAVELDSALCGILERELPSNVTVVNADFLKADLIAMHEESGGDICVCGNLPYYITSPICMRLITCDLPIRRMVLMMQREASERFFARPGDRNYVPLTVLARLKYDIQNILDLSPASYYPQPDVSSSVLCFDRTGAEIPDNLPRLLKAAFASRRKTLVNNLSAMGLSKQAAGELLERAGIPGGARAEELEPEDFLRLSLLALSECE